MIWLCIASVLSVTSVISDQNIDTSHIRVFPAVNQSIAGVFHISFVNDLNQPQYAFNVSEARRLCSSLGLYIASKAQVQEALMRGLETCRFGWIDEHLAVIPRIKALSNCGKSQTGLVIWRASVTQKFDVFCFNESDATAQLKDTTSNSSLSSRDYSGQTNSTQVAHSSSSPLPSTSSAPRTSDFEAESTRYVSSTQGLTEAKIVLITSTCTLLFTAIIILAYIKLKRSCSQDSDMKQQQKYVQTLEWACVTNAKETHGVKEDKRIQVDAS